MGWLLFHTYAYKLNQNITEGVEHASITLPASLPLSAVPFATSSSAEASIAHFDISVVVLNAHYDDFALTQSLRKTSLMLTTFSIWRDRYKA